MEWYSGSVDDAVKTSKLKKAIFVVFITGNDETSTELTRLINTPEISSCLKTEDFVSIILETGTEDYNFFIQIYRLAPVPSLFFIGQNGKPLEIVSEVVSISTIKTTIDRALIKAGKKVSNTSSAFINAEQSDASALNIPQPCASNSSNCSSSDVVSTQSTKETATNSSADIKPEASVTADLISDHNDVVTSNADNDNGANQQLTTAEKIERARELIELQKQQQLEKEKEEEKQRELERRNIGKHVQNARRRQQDMELALAHEERMKEKALEREARERVMKQIAQDKLERKEREQALLQKAIKNQQDQEEPEPVPPTNGDGIAKIQFRVPSGYPHTANFFATTTLGELRNYVWNNIDLPFQQFSLSLLYPRQDLKVEDDEKTLLELGLVPAVGILILPAKSPGASTVRAHDDSFLSRFLWALFAPILTVYNYMTEYLFGGASGGTNSQSNDTTMSGNSARSDGDTYGSNNVGQSPGLIRGNMDESSRTVRARGNIHRLHSGSDDNDENNTWNGNSTQQM